MTKDEAAHTVRTFLDAHGVRVARPFDGGPVVGVMLGAAELFFEYADERGELVCGALVYRFRREPRAGVLEAFEREAQGGAADPGGGRADYRPESRSLLLTRAYLEPVAEADFARDMDELARASLRWAGEVADRAATRAFRAEEEGA